MPCWSYQINFLSTNSVQIFSTSNIPFDLKSSISDKLKVHH